MNQNLAAIGDTGSALLEQWNAAVARYNAARAQFAELFADKETLQSMSADERARIADVAGKMELIEQVISKIGEWAQSGADIWASVKGALSRINPLAGIFGLGEFQPPGLGLPIVPLAALAVLGLALYVLNNLIPGVIAATERMAIARQVRLAGGTAQNVAQAVDSLRWQQLAEAAKQRAPLIIGGVIVVWIVWRGLTK